MKNPYSIAADWSGDFDESGLARWAEDLRRQLPAAQVSLGLVFMSPRFFSHAGAVLELLRVHARVPLLAGCSGASLIAGGREIEEAAGLVVGLYSLPEAELKPIRLLQEQVEESSGPAYWLGETQVAAEETNGWLAFLDPFSFDGESWLRGWNEAYAPRPIVGGLASGDHTAQSTQLYLNGDVFTDGGIAISIGGGVRLASVISQGCTPIGETWTITRAEGNVIHEIGNRPAYAVLAETFNALPPAEQQQARRNLFVGLVVNEYLEEFHRGDFLIRQLLGADARSGAIAVGALVRTGQTMQFQRRAASAGTEDIEALLARARGQLKDHTVYGGCLCSCNGRGARLFGQPDHDARHVQQAFGPIGLAGFFCNGEIGPIGEENFLHGYTASLALFVKKP